MTQLVMFGAHAPKKRTFTGEERRDRAMRAAANATPPGWLDAARQAVLDTAARLGRFTADDVWATGLTRPANPRALGPVMRMVSKEGHIRPTPTFVPTRQATRNAAPVRVWEAAP